jgi:hypothetical protein
VALALSVASEAIDEGVVDVALQALAWAKHEAPRVATIREAYGVALYLDERFADALSELQAYRRMTGRTDQNHLVADCLRALGRGLDRVAAAAEELVTDTSAPEDRRAEAAIVWAAALADAGDVATGRAVVRRILDDVGGDDGEHVLRLHYLAAELAGKAGDPRDREHHLSAIADVDPESLDLAALGGASEPGTAEPPPGP